jgi:surfactin synthase thioesterase subunit
MRGQVGEAGIIARTTGPGPLVNLDEATVWKEHTRAGLELESFAGGHFYLTAHVLALAGTVTGRLAPGG